LIPILLCGIPMQCTHRVATGHPPRQKVLSSW